MQFNLVSPYNLTPGQKKAVEQLVKNFSKSEKQTLLGITGSGKTFTLANVIQQTQRPTLVISHNKTLAAQLYQEFRDYFPQNAVSYFVSYYDYYQPEAYIPQTDTYIEKETEINEEIDKRGDSLASVIKGEDTLWDVSVIKFIYELTRNSVMSNFNQMNSRGLFHTDSGGVPLDARLRIDELIHQVHKGERDPRELKEELDRWGLFDEYEDRFYSIFRGKG